MTDYLDATGEPARPLSAKRNGRNCGRICGMKTTIDRAGRVVVPKALRQAVGLQPGSQLELRLVGGRIEMEPAPLDVNIEDRGGLLVAVPVGSVPPMSSSAVAETLAAVRERGVRRSGQ